MTGQKIWQPTDADYDMQGLGGHCMCVIGYDDYLEGGAFQLMNSWGTEWGINGNCYVKYADFAHFTKEAYGVYPMGEVKTPEPTALELAFDLVPNGTKTGLALTQIDEHTFRTKQPLALGTAFKVRISNNAETYIYIFGEETDGSNYVLFPYTPKHSPYCGITGTRIFPKDYSMEVDAKGTRDVMAVVVSQQPIDFNKLNDALNSQKGKKFGDRLRTVLNDELADAQLQTTPQGLSASRMLDSKNAMFWVVEVDK
jgi:hypothetical protein